MKRTSEFIELGLYAINQGQSFSQISDILINTDTKRIEYLTTNDGYNIYACSILPYDCIYGIGDNFITTEDSSLFVSLEQCYSRIVNLLSFKVLQSLVVMSVAGQIVGQVLDISFDEKTGMLTELITEAGDSLPVDIIVKITKDYVFVNNGKDAIRPMVKRPILQTKAEAIANASVYPGAAAYSGAVHTTPIAPVAYTAPTPAPAEVQPVPAIEEVPDVSDLSDFFADNVMPDDSVAPVITPAIQMPTPAPMPSPASIPEKPAMPEKSGLAARAEKFGLIGKRVPKDILDNDGTMLASRGDEITSDLLELLKSKNKASLLL